MEENKEVKTDNGSKPATEAQMKLLEQLCDELGFEGDARSDFLVSHTIESASQHIHYLKERKLRDAQLRLQNAKVQGFDKITFAMLYKLFAAEKRQGQFEQNCFDHGMQEAMAIELRVYKEAEAHCKAWVAEGGSQ